MMPETRLRLSHSSLELLNTCERKFQLQKLLSAPKEEESAHLFFGKAFGAGIASYMLTHSAEKAIFAAWLEYDSNLEEKRKNKWTVLGYLIQAFPKLNDLLQDYEVAVFKGKPAIELSFKLSINASKYFVGHIDVVLRHKVTGKYYVMEVKTTSDIREDLAPNYRHSGQGVGYSVALDSIVGEELSEYGVLYFVCQLPRYNAVDNIAKFHCLPFHKTLSDRLQWFVTIGLDVQKIEAMEAVNIFPKRLACTNYGRTCVHYGTCHLQQFDKPAIPEPDTIVYDFEFELDAVIDNHLERISRLPPSATMTMQGELTNVD